MNTDWRQRLQQLVEKPPTSPFPLTVFNFRKPTRAEWPASLPCSELIREFYAICDGGLFSMDCEWYPVGDLVARNEKAHQLLAGYNKDGSSPLIRGRHLVFGHDAGGAPYIWDSQTDEVTTFWFKGGGWEKRADSFQAFLHRLLFRDTPTHADDLWYDALRQLDKSMG
jgi:hypothetical protein